MKRVLLVFGILLSASVLSHAQPGYNYDYNTEFVWGINKNTSSGLIGGFIIKHSKAIGPRQFRTLGLELMNIKHPNEVRLNSVVTGNFFIWAKEIYFYSIRGQYGREIILFKKASQQGIQINAQIAAGPSIGIKAPYYIEISSGSFQSAKVPYKAGQYNFEEIYGTGNLFQGIFESGFTVGANVKSSLAFEFGAFKSNVSGVEMGFLVDAYVNKIYIVPAAENTAVFPTAFITFYYGTRR
jgi:hypothetical protein